MLAERLGIVWKWLQTARPSLDNEMNQKCGVPAGIHDAGTKRD